MRSRRVPRLRAAVLASCMAVLAGCETPYLLQAARGEFGVLAARRPIDAMVTDARTPPGLRETLLVVRRARRFASRELGLPDNRSYRSYADIGRPFVVWNVVATPEFSVKPLTWCFPVAGCVAYRGYFSEGRARRFAARLQARTFDVTLDGVPAYSTLGRFADPVLSSMLPYGRLELVATIFHELAHQRLYVAGDSQFNEAFAVVVEDTGVARWLAREGSPAEIARLKAARARELAYVAEFQASRARLAAIYAAGGPPATLRAGKQAEFAALATRIHALEQSQGVPAPLYERWIRDGLNNARLASLATYYDCVPGFERLLHAADDDLPAFYAAAAALGRKPLAERRHLLCAAPVQEVSSVRATDPAAPAGQAMRAARP